jgi:hypothetical protein
MRRQRDTIVTRSVARNPYQALLAGAAGKAPYSSRFTGTKDSWVETNYTHVQFKMTTCTVSDSGVPRLTATDQVHDIFVASNWRKDLREGRRGEDSACVGKGWYKHGAKVCHIIVLKFNIWWSKIRNRGN